MKNITKNTPQINIPQETAAQYEENLDLLQLIGKFIKRLRAFPKTEERSEAEKKILLMQQIIWLTELEKNPLMRQRLALFRQEMEAELEVQIHGNAIFRKRACTRQWEEVLRDHSKKQLIDLHKYLVTGNLPEGEGESLAAGLAAWLGSHPQQLLLSLSQGAAECLFQLEGTEEKGRLAVNEENLDSYTEAAMWGLIDINLMDDHGTTCLEMSLPEQVKNEILPALKKISRESLEANGLTVYLSPETLQRKINLRRLNQDFEIFEDNIYTFLETYGFMEKEDFREMFCRAWKIDVDMEELMRFVYLHGTVHKRLMTAELKEGGEVFVSLPWVEINEMMEKRNQYCKDIPYPVLSRKEILNSHQRFAGIWRSICDVFQKWDLEEEALEDIFQEGLCLATEGGSVSEIMEFLLDWCPVENPGERALLWRLSVLAGLSAPLYMLKGYSRHDFFEKYGKYKYLDLFTQTEKKIRKASLYELPVSLQEQLADLAVLAWQGKYQEVAELEKEISTDYQFHEEMKLFLFVNRAEAYAGTGIKDRQSKECKEVRALALSLCEECRDSETEYFILDICGANDILSVQSREPVPERWEDDIPYGGEQEEGSARTVVKGEKIYPNDPCPCGSGKKYKKCCGRKQ